MAKYKRKPLKAEAVVYSAETLNDFVKLVGPLIGRAVNALILTAEYAQVDTPGDAVRVPLGHWLAVVENGVIRAYNETDFAAAFEQNGE